ncbi:IDEAL domain-containing protein [Staphylococcus hominis]|uniref:IDEAL domain-containing protein n=1 Tax=Staphylococcus hominis TaxID=1290 RepID=UPI0007789A5B|nr:IDEAL domain-containing protein [Staphylococcus hominis]MBK1406626.1 IDEAL domain-containing protein [Staphylococcus hominis]MCE4949202.1 IDEAL domain-containing protein [Staphylococcus hominis]MCE4951824.1 IDEAL domain-containing protein [Staphylococcus hominis]MCE4976007.1 IDEAL domain-containing protein [Staphylococcus hominis]OAW32729.1 IDEAL domain protein [Staphylococcus hominis]
MYYNTNVKHTTLEEFVTTMNDLGVELVIDEALRLERKKQLVILIDEALVNRNEDDFNQYTTELKHLEAFLNE